MITDGSTRLGADCAQLTREFRQYGITLAVVLICTPAYDIWNFFRDLSHNTGMRKEMSNT